MSEQKKTYTAPQLAEYGKVEKETKGVGGTDWEPYATKPADSEPSRA